MNIAHTDGKKSYPGTAGILNITPETVSSQLLSWTRYFFHNYFNGLNTAVNTSYAWLDNIDYGLNKHTMCTVSQSTAQLFWLSPQSFKCWQLLERSLIGFYIAYLCSSYLLFKEEWSEECCIFGFFVRHFPVATQPKTYSELALHQMPSLSFHSTSTLLARDLPLSNPFLAVFWKAKGETGSIKYFDQHILISSYKSYSWNISS